MAKEPEVSSSQLQPNAADLWVVAAKALIGSVPYAGSLLGEVIGAIIPNQRIDRISKFAADLNGKICHLDQSVFRIKLADENFTDLLEEAILQAVKSLTDDRRKYIAHLVSLGVSLSEKHLMDLKRMLKILGEINDAEVLLLRSHIPTPIGGDKEFRDRHKDVVQKPYCPVGADLERADKDAIYDGYLHHLWQLGLLDAICRRTSGGGFLDGGKMDNVLRADDYKINRLGGLLLRHIGLAECEEGNFWKLKAT